MSTMQGQTLPNGYGVIEVTVRADKWTVLTTDQHSRYAVWDMQPNEPASTSNPFYTVSLGKAVIEYHRRSGRLEVIEMALREIAAKDRHPSNVIVGRVMDPIPAGSLRIFEAERKRTKDKG